MNQIFERTYLRNLAKLGALALPDFDEIEYITNLIKKSELVVFKNEVFYITIGYHIAQRLFSKEGINLKSDLFLYVNNRSSTELDRHLRAKYNILKDEAEIRKE